MRGDYSKSVVRYDRKTVESLPLSDPRRQLVDDIFDRVCSFLCLHNFLFPDDVVSFNCVDTVFHSDRKLVSFSFNLDLR